MSGRTARVGGSRFLYEPFDPHAARLETHERVNEERWIALERRLLHMEATLDRIERRMWLSISGVTAFLAADVAYTILTNTS